VLSTDAQIHLEVKSLQEAAKTAIGNHVDMKTLLEDLYDTLKVNHVYQPTDRDVIVGKS